MSENTETKQDYPGLSNRVRAMIVDAVVMIIFMILATYLFSWFNNAHDFLRIITFIFIFFLYDPIFTSSFGGTIGHFMLGIRVKRNNDQNKNIIFPVAVARFFFKACMGWISLITVTTNIKKRAIHDFITGSIVVYSE